MLAEFTSLAELRSSAVYLMSPVREFPSILPTTPNVGLASDCMFVVGSFVYWHDKMR